jgi:DNA-binding NarL/FixJ family response regulator
MTIAIVDDDPDDRETFCATIRDIRPDATCLQFQDPQELAVHLSNADGLPNFLFVDMNMPRVNGLECILQLKTIDRYKEMKIAVYSTLVSPAQRKRFAQLDVTIILKSGSPADLARAIEFCLAEVNEG